MPVMDAVNEALSVTPVFVGQPDGVSLVFPVTVGDTESVDVIVGVYENVGVVLVVGDSITVRVPEYDVDEHCDNDTVAQ